MIINCCSIKFYLHGNKSLKGKRQVVRFIKDRLKNNFNVSVPESWESEQLVKSPHQNAHSRVRSPVHGWFVDKGGRCAIDRMNLAQITDYKTETMNLCSGNF